jgi:hypothetical protein
MNGQIEGVKQIVCRSVDVILCPLFIDSGEEYA